MNALISDSTSLGELYEPIFRFAYSFGFPLRVGVTLGVKSKFKSQVTLYVMISRIIYALGVVGVFSKNRLFHFSSFSHRYPSFIRSSIVTLGLSLSILIPGLPLCGSGLLLFHILFSPRPTALTGVNNALPYSVPLALSTLL